mgnify:CR=1 FL=1
MVSRFESPDRLEIGLEPSPMTRAACNLLQLGKLIIKLSTSVWFTRRTDPVEPAVGHCPSKVPYKAKINAALTRRREGEKAKHIRNHLRIKKTNIEIPHK